MTKNLIYLPLGILSIATLTAGAVLMARPTVALTCTTDPTTGQRTCTETATATVTVSGGACAFSSTGSGDYSVSLTAGNTQNGIGGTVLTASCNDTSAYYIYARGFSSDTAGNTNLIGSLNGVNIATGTATTGNVSAWAMMATPVSAANNNVPTIQNNYNAYKEVPTNSTSIATFQASTAANVGRPSSITTNYRIYVSPVQLPATYTGKVKYSLAEL